MADLEGRTTMTMHEENAELELLIAVHIADMRADICGDMSGEPTGLLQFPHAEQALDEDTRRS